MAGMDSDAIAALARATAKLKHEPKLLQHPQLACLREYVASVWSVSLDEKGIPLPKAPLQIELSDGEEDDEASNRQRATSDMPEAVVQTLDVADSDEEDSGRIPEDSGPYPPLPPARRKGEAPPEPTDEQVTACSDFKRLGNRALEKGNAGEAVEHFTKAIMTGAAAALLFARRGELLLKQGRPIAAVRDCDAAVEVNSDCGKAYRIRGLAYRGLGRFEAAHADLSLGQKLDYDESLGQVQKFVAEKAERAKERRLAAEKQNPRKRRRQAA